MYDCCSLLNHLCDTDCQVHQTSFEPTADSAKGQKHGSFMYWLGIPVSCTPWLFSKCILTHPSYWAYYNKDFEHRLAGVAEAFLPQPTTNHKTIFADFILCSLQQRTPDDNRDSADFWFPQICFIDTQTQLLICGNLHVWRVLPIIFIHLIGFSIYPDRFLVNLLPYLHFLMN